MTAPSPHLRRHSLRSRLRILTRAAAIVAAAVVVAAGLWWAFARVTVGGGF